MKRFAFAALGVLAVSLSSGCCGWLWPCGYSSGYGYGYPSGSYGYPYGAPSGGCPSGNCGTSPGSSYVQPRTSHYGSYESMQTGAPQIIDGPVTFAPTGYPAVAVPETASLPLESLPTY